MQNLLSCCKPGLIFKAGCKPIVCDIFYYNIMSLQIKFTLCYYRATHQMSGDHDDHNSTGYKELETQIQSALEETIRLRADTESLHNRIL